LNLFLGHNFCKSPNFDKICALFCVIDRLVWYACRKTWFPINQRLFAFPARVLPQENTNAWRFRNEETIRLPRQGRGRFIHYRQAQDETATADSA
jgi:hypothetical protein